MREKRGRKRKCVSIKTLWRFVSNASAFYLKRKCVFQKGFDNCCYCVIVLINSVL